MAGRKGAVVSMPGYSESEIAALPATIGTEEAARILRTSARSVRAAVARGDLPGGRVGSTWVLPRDGVLAVCGLDFADVAAAARRRAAAEAGDAIAISGDDLVAVGAMVAGIRAYLAQTARMRAGGD